MVMHLVLCRLELRLTRLCNNQDKKPWYVATCEVLVTRSPTVNVQGLFLTVNSNDSAFGEVSL